MFNWTKNSSHLCVIKIALRFRNEYITDVKVAEVFDNFNLNGMCRRFCLLILCYFQRVHWALFSVTLLCVYVLRIQWNKTNHLRAK